jgi:hypothetical protein
LLGFVLHLLKKQYDEISTNFMPKIRTTTEICPSLKARKWPCLPSVEVKTYPSLTAVTSYSVWLCRGPTL